MICPRNFSRDLPQLGFHLLGSDVDAIGQHAGISVVAATTQQVRQLQDRYGVALQVGSYLTPLQPEAPSGLPPAPAGARTAVDGLFLVDARTLRVELPVGGGCDTTGTAAAVAQESPARIVLRGTVRGRTRPHGVRVCNKMLLVQAIVVRLSAPLGTREVVDGLTGRILRRG